MIKQYESLNLKHNTEKSHACIMCLAVLSSLLNLMRGGNSGSGKELSSEESTEFVSVDINLLWKWGTSTEPC